MKALVKKDYRGKLEIEEVPEPLVLPDSVKIEVKVAGICGTDLHILKNEYKHNVPVIIGHEFAGIVAEISEGVTSCLPGDRVVSLTAAVTCGLCDYCIAGIPMLCKSRLSIGSGINGAFAKYLVVHQRLIKKIPDNISFDEAALTEPLACTVHGIMEMGRVKAGDVVLISGPGTIGLLALQVAKAEGGVTVVCGTADDKDRLEIAKSLGADHVVDMTECNIVDFINNLTGGEGADIAIECAGIEVSAKKLCGCLERKGTIPTAWFVWKAGQL